MLKKDNHHFAKVSCVIETESHNNQSRMTMRQFALCLRDAVVNWWKRDPFTQSAAIAYYTIFSFPALMILYFASASLFIEQDQLQAQTYTFLSDKFGENSASQFKDIIKNSAPDQTSLWAFLIGGATLLFAGLKLFMQFQKALNHIWGISEKFAKGFKALVWRRAVSFSVMLGIGFTLFASLLMTSLITVFTTWIMTHLPDYFAYLFHGMNLAISLSIITFMFALLLKELPDIEVTWRHSLVGALISALLYLLGEYMMGLYFGIAKPDSAYGVTGSIILLMLWVSYSSVILLLGAEISKSFCDYENSKIEVVA